MKKQALIEKQKELIQHLNWNLKRGKPFVSHPYHDWYAVKEELESEIKELEEQITKEPKGDNCIHNCGGVCFNPNTDYQDKYLAKIALLL